jgi:cell division protein FtsX
MDMVVENMPILDEAKNAVEIVVHISENLEDMQRNSLVVALENEDGIVSAVFCPLRAQKLQARLIGPI